MHKQSLALAENAPEPDDTRIATRLNNLALVYWDQFRYDEAEPLLVRSLEIAEQAHDRDDADLALPLNNLARLYMRMERPEAAATLVDRAIAVWQGGDDDAVFTAILLDAKAEVLIGLGHYDEALEPAETALRAREQVGNLEKTARSYHTLAYLYFKLGRHDEPPGCSNERSRRGTRPRQGAS